MQLNDLATKKNIKIYFVDEDDDDREHVLMVRADHINVTVDNDYDKVSVDELLDSACIYKTAQRYTIEPIELLPDPVTGAFMTYHNFMEEDEEE